MARLAGGRILLSVNPGTRYRETWNTGKSWACHPHLLQFDAGAPTRAPLVLQPVWDQDYEFTEHSYRGIAADAERGEILLLNIVGHEGQAWSFMDSSGAWTRNGMIRFPLRACYPHVALVNRAACITAVSEIIEPSLEWRDYKRRVTGNEMNRAQPGACMSSRFPLRRFARRSDCRWRTPCTPSSPRPRATARRLLR